MFIIRYEDAMGNGPYSSPRLGFRASHANKPLPVDEGLGLVHSSKRSGFVSIEQLNGWFSLRDQVNMEAQGFLRVEYSVPQEDVMFSDNQALFLTANAVVTDSEHN